MKRYLVGILLGVGVILAGCSDKKSPDALRFVTSADYPPFEYRENGKLVGFEIALAKLIAKELGKEAVFKDMPFSTVLVALQNNFADAAISTITVTEERKQNFDFSNSFYAENLVVIYKKDKPIVNRSELKGKKIAVQLGTTMAIWLKENAPTTTVMTVDNNNQAVEALKAGHVDGVLIDSFQGKAFSEKNAGLDWAMIAKSDAGYAIAVKKGSMLVNQINKALKVIEERGDLKQLKQKWLGED